MLDTISFGRRLFQQTTLFIQLSKDIYHLIFCTALSLKCNLCYSTDSMEKCKEAEKLTDCPESADRCSKLSLEYKILGGIQFKSYKKSCSMEALCGLQNAAFKTCKGYDNAKCELDCCDSDGCNGGSAPLASVLLIVACLLWTIFR